MANKKAPEPSLPLDNIGNPVELRESSFAF